MASVTRENVNALLVSVRMIAPSNAAVMATLKLTKTANAPVCAILVFLVRYVKLQCVQITAMGVIMEFATRALAIVRLDSLTMTVVFLLLAPIMDLSFTEAVSVMKVGGVAIAQKSSNVSLAVQSMAIVL